VAVLRPEDQVIFGGGEHQVVALAGTSVRLRSLTVPKPDQRSGCGPAG